MLKIESSHVSSLVLNTASNGLPKFFTGRIEILQKIEKVLVSFYFSSKTSSPLVGLLWSQVDAPFLQLASLTRITQAVAKTVVRTMYTLLVHSTCSLSRYETGKMWIKSFCRFLFTLCQYHVKLSYMWNAPIETGCVSFISKATMFSFGPKQLTLFLGENLPKMAHSWSGQNFTKHDT